MTGTAIEAADEFGDFYNLQIVIVPPNRPCVRTDHPDRVFANSFLSAIEEKAVVTLRDATFTSAGIDLEKEGLRGPSSTWTFMINDNPRGNVLNAITDVLLRDLKKLFAQ